MDKKMTWLMEPGLRIYLLVLALFALASAFLSPWLGFSEGVAGVALYLYLRAGRARRKRELLRYLESMSFSVDTAARDTMANSPLAMVIFRPETGEVIWSNERFLRLIGRQEHLFDTRLDAAVPNFDTRWLMEGKNRCPSEVEVDAQRFLVFGHLVRQDEKGGRGGFLATTYWVDVTEYSSLREAYYTSRPVVAVLLM
ncbi:MAG: DHH family phosphoesterase, partial [Clostridia bacterium]|nr:DHH family phosphoesterase [Clostridia bacterium]